MMSGSQPPARRQDPFDAFRSNLKGTSFAPFDTLSAKRWSKTLADIKSGYFKYARLTNGQLPGDDVLREQWTDCISHALINDEYFQDLVIEHALTSTSSYAFSDLNAKRNQSWLAGIYLPGFYHKFGNFSKGCDRFPPEVINQAIKSAVTTLEAILSEVAISEGVAEEYQVMPRSRTTNEFIATLFQKTQNEKHGNNMRMNLYDNLRAFGDATQSAELESSKSWLMQKYRNTLIIRKADSLIDKFGSKAMEVLEECGKCPAVAQMPRLTEEEIAMVKQLRDRSAKKEEQNKAAKPMEPKGKGESEAQTMVPEYQWLRMEVTRRYSRPICYPRWGKPLGHILTVDQSYPHPKVKSSELEDFLEEETILSESTSDILKMADDILSGREVSYKGAAALEPSPNIVSKCVEHINSETRRKLHKSSWDKMIQELASITARPDEARTATITSSVFHGFRKTMMLDNWLHVRKLFQAITVHVSSQGHDEGGDNAGNDSGDDTLQCCREAERQLVMVLAAIGTGAEDPLPWILTLDYVLCNNWRAIQARLHENHLNPDSPLLNVLIKIYNELVLFAHGAAIVAVLQRTHSQQQRNPFAWYESIRKFNSKCADTDCTRLLPNPEHIAEHQMSRIKTFMSVEACEARLGNCSVRSFISNNRQNGYNCLSELLAFYTMDEQLVILVFWYNHIFHAECSKPSQGELQVNCF
ncbi:uncharacterized protein K452DRAFT_354867 [Aplosporella prunicola CBS 121167]|uniref:Uncharacterized protein n=1 Tax=Aplosporella prunicola CBS 121167 TaxID=1176127 RepID=A0A6A6BX64_9PEZI|nr:uncharacterized protein K452DRAFT_354867 [Aplosporella prunicola CBS 121167]KAF2147497.1 hypothetical protein K452DRAFT_354867 [Aplosporella prunicola CBS 121167]